MRSASITPVIDEKIGGLSNILCRTTNTPLDKQYPPGAFREKATMSWNALLQPEIIVFVIGGVAIVVSGTVAIIKVMVRHRERMTMIEQGMHPDHPPDEESAEHDPPDELQTGRSRTTNP